MKWAFLLGSPDISGGTYVIYEHALGAARRGIDVTILTEEPIDKARLNWHPEAKELRWWTYDAVADRSFDIAIATWWRTAYELHRVNANSYAYFVQSIESRFYQKSEEAATAKLVDGTYLLPLKIVTEANWIRSHLSESYNVSARVVRNGIRKDIYTLDGERYAKRKEGNLRVLVEGPLGVPFKNVERTIDLCRSSAADEIWLLTSTPIKSYPGVDRVFAQVPIFDTAKIYRSCDVLVKLSYVEGMFGPPLEMFHCGGTAVVYDVSGHDEYIVHNGNAIVVRRDNEKDVIAGINELKKSRSWLDQLKRGALETSYQWPSWQHASLEFEGCIAEIAKSTVVSRKELEKKSLFLLDFYRVAEQLRLHGDARAAKQWRWQRAKDAFRNRSPRLYRLLAALKWRIIFLGRRAIKE